MDSSFEYKITRIGTVANIAIRLKVSIDIIQYKEFVAMIEFRSNS